MLYIRSPFLSNHFSIKVPGFSITLNSKTTHMYKLLLLGLLTAASASAQETLLLRSPSVSETKIAFAYGGDIWSADRDGSHPQRLTVSQDEEISPMLSPD